ncbi:MAG TPA: hypothetical protein DGG94_07020 [Micromonosporaceae bacterium]|nr:hypothetical protein [Micromonosporaceae bacterium]
MIGRNAWAGSDLSLDATPPAWIQQLIASAIRDNIGPEPHCHLRWVEHETKHVLLLDVEGPAMTPSRTPLGVTGAR